MLFLIIVIVYSLDTIRIDQSCSTGLTGYFWNGQQCVQCKKPACRCQQPYECTSCINNYYYETNSKDCIPCPLGCVKCCKSDEMTQYICTLCQQNYIMISGICLYVGVCTQISIHGKCQSCPEAYYLHEECKKCPEGCASCDSLFYCTSCQDGYYGSTVEDKRLCASCNAETLVGCNQCEWQLIFDLDTLLCMNCLDYYFFDEFTGLCKKCPENCLSCQNPDQIPQICYVCGVGYLLTQENSACQNCQDQIKNCMTCAMNEHNTGFICIKCENGYYLSKDQLECVFCKTIINHARRCNSETAITQCEVGYLLLQDELNNYSCIKNINNCYTISNDKAECFNCLPNFTLTLSIALQIQVCQNCENTIKNCLLCSTDSNQQLICKQCISGYYGEQCIQCTQNCDVCLNQNQCSSCLSGYFLDSQQQCQSCEVDFCVTCTTVKQCTKCQLSYGLFDSKCQKCLLGCEECDSNLDKCDQCAENFYLTKKEENCKRYKDNCVYSNINGYCYLCETVIDYDPYKEIFQDESIDNLEIYPVQPAIFYISNNGYCLKCNDESTGTYNCPQICKIEEQSQKLLQLMILLISILF